MFPTFKVHFQETLKETELFMFISTVSKNVSKFKMQEMLADFE